MIYLLFSQYMSECRKRNNVQTFWRQTSWLWCLCNNWLKFIVVRKWQ